MSKRCEMSFHFERLMRRGRRVVDFVVRANNSSGVNSLLLRYWWQRNVKEKHWRWRWRAYQTRLLSSSLELNVSQSIPSVKSLILINRHSIIPYVKSEFSEHFLRFKNMQECRALPISPGHSLKKDISTPTYGTLRYSSYIYSSHQHGEICHY